MPHIAIIGAGPAGSSAAIILARAGVAVTLIEQHRFPRDKVCGECLSFVGIDVIHRLHLFPSLLARNPVDLRRALLFTPGDNRLELPLPRPMLGISRLVLDELLLGAARDAGARIFQPARCEQIAPDGTSQNNAVWVRDLCSNCVTIIKPDFVLLADGKSSLMPIAPPPTGDFGLKAHFTNVSAPRDAIMLFGVHGHYGGLAPIERERWNLAFSVPSSRIKPLAARRFRLDFDSLLDAFCLENPALKSALGGARREGNWLISPLPRFDRTRNWPDGIIPIGNAAAAVEPVGGEGIGLALRSAELAAMCLLDAWRENRRPDLNGQRAAYARLWRLRRLACRAAALAISSPRLSGALAPFVQPGDPLVSLALRAIGKSDFARSCPYP